MVEKKGKKQELWFGKPKKRGISNVDKMPLEDLHRLANALEEGSPMHQFISSVIDSRKAEEKSGVGLPTGKELSKKPNTATTLEQKLKGVNVPPEAYDKASEILDKYLKGGEEEGEGIPKSEEAAFREILKRVSKKENAKA